VEYLRRKWTVRAHGQSLVLIKKPIESAEHVLQKALLWARYLPYYPALRVEVPLPQPSRYKPDLLALAPTDEPLFWGECGVVSTDKLQFLLNRYRNTHFVFSRWNVNPAPYAAAIDTALPRKPRRAPIELITFPASASEWFLPDGTIAIDDAQLQIQQWQLP
jgi:hypothetical protein